MSCAACSERMYVSAAALLPLRDSMNQKEIEKSRIEGSRISRGRQQHAVRYVARGAGCAGCGLMKT